MPRTVAVFLAACALCGPAWAGSTANVTVTGIGTGFGSNDFQYHGFFDPAGGAPEDRIRAFSMGFTACNLGGVAAEFSSSHAGSTAGRHPVAVQNLYRLLDGRFEQVGMSWAFHLFCAVNEPGCGTCAPTSCSTLGDGCGSSEPSTITGDPAAMGRRTGIDPWPATGVPTHLAVDGPTGPAAIRGRLQVTDGDILDGGLHFAEVHYVTHDEVPDDRHDNAGWRPVTVTSTDMDAAGETRPHEPAIFAWREHDPAVAIKVIDVPGDGRMYLGFVARDNGDATWDYEYALYNMSSARAARSFRVPVPFGVSVSTFGFHDVPYHSGDGIDGESVDGMDWSMGFGGGAISWSTPTRDANPNGNALRWGTLYNFRFRATGPPAPATIEVGLFVPGAPETVSITALAPSRGDPSCPTDVNFDGTTDVNDLVLVILDWGTDDASDVNGDGVVDVNDLVLVILEWGPCV